MDPDAVRRSVAEVIAEVRRRGDQALLDFTARWDGVRLASDAIRVPARVLARPVPDTPFTRAFRAAVERIRRFHELVRPRTVIHEDADGVLLGLRWTPIESAGIYVPGGKAAYPSTLAMTAVPAQVAGVERIAVVSPPGPDGEVSEIVLLAARILGLGEVYRAGGAQAVAALALGTKTIARVDKVFGPGNAYVAEAKVQLFGEVGVDLVAGPSEIVVYADEFADPEWVAADLLAQAEHDESTRVTLLASSTAVMEEVRRAMAAQIATATRRAVIEVAIERGGTFEVVEGPEAAAERINAIAPEHLSLQVADPWAVLGLVRNAGAIFLGKESPVAVGDYYAGPNHVLPTGGTARFASALSVEDFMKRSNVVRTDLDFVRRSAGDIEELARGEGLPGHAASIALRCALPSQPFVRCGLRSVTAYELVEEDAEVKLNQNESPWDIPAEVKDEVARRLRDLPWNRYHQKLPEELLRRLADDSGFPPEGVIAATGSNLALQWVFEACGGPGATVLTAAPSFALYPLWTRVTEARLETVPLGPRFEYDAGRLLDRVEKLRPQITVLCLPNNPTGTELETPVVRALALAARRGGGVLVVDEAYREFSDPAFDRSALAREVDNVLLVRTFSKAYSAAGMRLGYVLAPVDLARELRKLVPPFHVSIFSAVLGIALLERKAAFRERVACLVAEREKLAVELSRLGGVEVFPSHANFLLMRVRGARKVFEELRARGILVRMPGSDPALEDCLRVNMGTDNENTRLLAALREIVSGDRTRPKSR
jgi:histidinol dehydrogenase